MTRWLAILFLLLSSSVAHGAATYATLSGTVLDNDGSPCVSCNVTIRTAATQVVGGETFPEESFGVTHVTDANGDLPAGVFVARTLIVGISLANDPNEVRVRIPDQASVNIGDLILPPVAPPVGCTGCIVSANIATGAVTTSKIGATDAPADEECLTYESTGPTLEWQTCGSGGGSSNSFETWDTPAGTDIVADSATDTVQFLASGIVSITGGGAADTITIGATEVGDITDVGDCTGPACFSGASGNSLHFEGSTADGFETTLTATDPTADRTATLPNFSGTIAMERVYDVRAYGALCNDSADDTAEIQAAIDAAEATGKGGVVELPVGICIVTGLNINEPGITLRGQGAGVSNNATVLSCNLTTGTCVTLDSACTYGCGLESMVVSARGSVTSLTLIDGTNASNDFVRNVTSSSQQYCVAIKNVGLIQDVSLFTPVAGASCRAISIVDDAVFMERAKVNFSTNIEGAIVIEQTVAGQADTVVLSDVEVAQSGGAGAGLKIMGTSAVNPPRWIQVSNSLFEAKTTGATTGDYAIWLSNVRDFKCSSCYAQGGYNAVRVSGGPGPITFAASVIGNSMREALYHDADVVTTLVGTTVSDGGTETDNTYSDIYLSANSRGFTMIGGAVGAELLGFPGNDPKYGIEVDASASEYRFSDVNCSDVPDSGCASGLTPAAAQVAFTDGTAYADSDWSNYVLVRAPSLAGNWTLTLPTADGATGDLLYDSDGSGTLGWRTPNAGTDITADLEEEAHATEHSLGGTDAITVTNLASACSDAQVLGGNAGGTGVECQADVDTNANTICSGTTTYLDGEGNCDDIAAVYAPIGATFITQTASAALTGEQAMGALGTGLVLNTTTTGVQSIYTGTSCTNQFPRSLNASGAATCASVVSADITDGTITAGDLGTDSVAADELSTAAIDEVMAAAVGTGLDLDTATTPDSLDVDITELSLTKGFVWQGNSSDLATAYSNPSGLDVRTFGAACDGSTDDSTAFTNCLAAVDGTDEGTCLVPATGNACVIADVTLPSGANLVCTPGARLEAKSTVTNAMLYASSAISNVRISGCIFNLDQVEKDGIKINSGSSGIKIDNNQFWWNYNAEAAGSGTTALDYVEMGCADTASTTLSCTITGNMIVGSNRDAQDDTGINVLDGGGILGLGSDFLIASNAIVGTGGNCMSLQFAGVINSNLMYGCGEAGIYGQIAQSVISNNEIYVNSSGGTFTIDGTSTSSGIQNTRIVGNNFPTNTGGRGAVRYYNGSGVQFANNYAADGIQVLQSAITGRSQHGAIKNNVFNAGNSYDDPFDGGTATANVVVENPVDLQVVSNSFVGTAPAGGYSAIRIQNSDTATFDVAQTRILNNIISVIGAAGTDNCMLFHDASGTANNGFINMQIVANSCGVEGATAINNCVLVNNVAEDSNWSDVFYGSNIFDDCSTVATGTRRAGEVQLDTDVFCQYYDNVGAATMDNHSFWVANQPTKVLNLTCQCNGSCTPTIAAVQLEDGSGNAIGSQTCTANTTASAWTDVSGDADSVLVQLERLQLEITNTPNPTTDEYMVCVEYRWGQK